jgi:hypothetical protein
MLGLMRRYPQINEMQPAAVKLMAVYNSKTLDNSSTNHRTKRAKENKTQ